MPLWQSILIIGSLIWLLCGAAAVWLWRNIDPQLSRTDAMIDFAAGPISLIGALVARANREDE